MLAIETLREVLYFDADTNCVRWKISFPKRKVGDRAGNLDVSKGYRFITFQGVKYPEQKIIYALHHGEWPKGIIDHSNRLRSDNTPDNLIDATYSDNNRNRLRTNKSGFRGVGFYPGNRKKPWQARVIVNKKFISLGMFLTAIEAAQAYDNYVINNIGSRFPTNANLGLI